MTHHPGHQTAFQCYRLQTQPDGSITGETETNDNLDKGYPNEVAIWSVKYRDFEEMKRRTGLTHVGCSGIQVIVDLDGKRI